MLRYKLLAVASFLATGSQAYAPIQMVSGQGKGLVVLPKGFPGNIRGALSPQKLSVRNIASNDSPSSIPYFTAKLDQTISWDDADWCLEAFGNKHGDMVRVNRCSGAPTQKWNWIPDGRGHNMIQLKDTELCLDAINKEFGTNGAPIELRVCGSEVAQWQFEEPLPVPGTSQSEDFSFETRHVMITMLALAGVGAISLGARIWKGSAAGHRGQETVPAVMALDSVQASLVPQTRESRTSEISMAEYKTLAVSSIPAFAAAAPARSMVVMTSANKKAKAAKRKQKTSRAVCKRFKATAGGKLLRHFAGKSHLRRKKRPQHLQALRGTGKVCDAELDTYQRLMLVFPKKKGARAARKATVSEAVVEKAEDKEPDPVSFYTYERN